MSQKAVTVKLRSQNVIDHRTPAPKIVTDSSLLTNQHRGRVPNLKMNFWCDVFLRNIWPYIAFWLLHFI